MENELYVIARGVLLDALEAIQEHRDAMVLVGAQAIYLRVGEAELEIAPYTTDGDLAIDPAILGEIPPLEEALLDAGFQPDTAQSVGIWVTHRATSNDPNTKVQVDLLVPESISPGKGRRAARLPGHDNKAARKVEGLEGAVVDLDEMTLAALNPEDPRSFEVKVAGPAALLVAKVYKIKDRKESSRGSDKDALDVLRILRGTELDDLLLRMQRLLDDERSEQATKDALVLFREQFTTPSSVGVEMAVRAVGALADPDEIVASCTLLAQDLLDGLEESG